jgi:hypothetical protein
MDEKIVKDAIEDIEALYPVDSEFPKTNEIGRKLLIMAILKHNWRKLPEEILYSYAELCRELERHEPGKGVVWNKVNNFNLNEL